MDINPSDWGMLFLFYLLMNMNRAIMVLIFYPFLKYFAYGFDWRQVKIIVFLKN